MSRTLLEDVLSCPTLPSLPSVAVEILELTGDPNVPMKKIAQADGKSPTSAEGGSASTAQ